MDLHHLAVHGTVSTADAASIGLDAYALDRLIRAGLLRRLVRGWYAVRDPGASRAPWEGADRYEEARAWHRLRTIALLRSFDGRAVASHQSALVLHGVGLWRSDLDAVQLCRTRDDHSRHRRGAVLHPSPATPGVVTSDGLATVPLELAVVQVGLGIRPGLGQPMESLVAADRALHDGLLTSDQLTAAVRLHAHHPGITAVRTLLGQADARHESVGETRLALAMRALGYRFTPQVVIRLEDGVAIVDFELDDYPVVVEFDGMAKYAGSGRAVAAEKVREDKLRRTGREVCRFTWPDLDTPQLIRAVINRAVDLSQRHRSA